MLPDRPEVKEISASISSWDTFISLPVTDIMFSVISGVLVAVSGLMMADKASVEDSNWTAVALPVELRLA